VAVDVSAKLLVIVFRACFVSFLGMRKRGGGEASRNERRKRERW